MIQENSGTSWEEMFRVFNMGHRLEIYTDESTAQEIISISKSFGVDAKVIGRVEEAPKKKLTILTENGQFEY